MMNLVKNWAVWQLMLAFAAFVLVSVPVRASTIIGSDVHTEGNASDWAAQFGAGTISDTSDAVVGSQAIKYNVPAGADGEMHLTFAPTIDLSGVSEILLQAKVSTSTTFAQSQIELLDASGNRRFIKTLFAQSLSSSYQPFAFPTAGTGDVGAFDITSVKEFEIRAIGPGADVDLFIDGLGTPVVIPEPSSFALSLFGGACSLLAFVCRPKGGSKRSAK